MGLGRLIRPLYILIKTTSITSIFQTIFFPNTIFFAGVPSLLLAPVHCKNCRGQNRLRQNLFLKNSWRGRHIFYQRATLVILEQYFPQPLLLHNARRRLLLASACRKRPSRRSHHRQQKPHRTLSSKYSYQQEPNPPHFQARNLSPLSALDGVE